MQDTSTANPSQFEDDALGGEGGHPVPMNENGIIPAIQITVFDDSNQISRQEQRPVLDFFRNC